MVCAAQPRKGLERRKLLGDTGEMIHRAHRADIRIQLQERGGEVRSISEAVLAVAAGSIVGRVSTGNHYQCGFLNRDVKYSELSGICTFSIFHKHW